MKLRCIVERGATSWQGTLHSFECTASAEVYTLNNTSVTADGKQKRDTMVYPRPPKLAWRGLFLFYLLLTIFPRSHKLIVLV